MVIPGARINAISGLPSGKTKHLLEHIGCIRRDPELFYVPQQGNLEDYPAFMIFQWQKRIQTIYRLTQGQGPGLLQAGLEMLLHFPRPIP